MSKNVLGCVEPYEPGKSFAAYEDRVNQMFIVNSVIEAGKTPLFITIMGAELYDVATSLCAPELPSKLTYSELIEKLRSHFEPKVNKRAERYKFYKMKQEVGESISDYIVRMKTAARTCKFGDYWDAVAEQGKFDQCALEDALTDKFITSVLDGKLQQRLLKEEDDDWDAVCKISLNWELTEKEVNAMRSQVSDTKAVRVQFKKQSQRDSTSKGARAVDQCRRCGRRHDEKTCPAVNWQCFTCSRTGHTSVMCFSKSKGSNNNKSHGEKSSNNNTDKSKSAHGSTSTVKVVRWGEPPEEKGTTKVVRNTPSQAMYKTITIEGCPIQMEVDTGAVFSLISFDLYKEKFSHLNLSESNVNLITVTGDPIRIRGEIIVRVGPGERRLQLVVVSDDRTFVSLLGRTWLDELSPGWRNKLFELPTHSIKNVSPIVDLIEQKFPLVLKSSPKQSIVGAKAEIILKECQPIFHAAYSVPFKVREKVKTELDRLVKKGILIQVKNSEWASPMVVVPKSNEEVRLCIDCKVTINRFIETEHYPIPKIEDIFASLSFARVFCVIDLRGAYQQIVVSEASQHYLTMNTIFGLYRYTRLPFGVASAPSIFQEKMERMLAGLEGVFCYLDDILIGGKDENECKERLMLVLQRLNEHHVQINIEKCKFLESSVKYLGHILQNGQIMPNPEKVRAITEAKRPYSIETLQSYLGLFRYYGKFIPNVSDELRPLYDLLHKDRTFDWNNECQAAFEKSKSLILSHNVLELYDPSKRIVVAADASPYGAGAVMSQLVNGEEKPVIFASCSLTPAQKNYSQIHREAFAIMFAVHKFHDYIFGHRFTLCTDQKALSEIFHPHKRTSGVAAARLHRWAIILSLYNFEIQHRNASNMAHADALSRLPLEVEAESETYEIKFIGLSESLIDRQLISKKTLDDPVLSKVKEFVTSSWRNQKLKNYEVQIQPFAKVRNDLVVENDCIYYRENIVIPSELRRAVLELLHAGHGGIVKMKQLARTYVWWPRITYDIDNFVSGCKICQQTLNVIREVCSTKWPNAKFPFERIHLDFFHTNGTNCLILVDAYSKYVEIVVMTTTNIGALIGKLLKFFTIFGLPTNIVTDNGPPYNSHIFTQFCESHGIILLHSPPYHPQSNGLAERGVQSAKDVLVKFCLGRERVLPLQDKIDRYLIVVRNTPSSVTGRTPSDMIFSFKAKTLLNHLNDKKFVSEMEKMLNDDKKIVNGNCSDKNVEKKGHEEQKIVIKFQVGQRVWYRNHLKEWERWVPAIVKEVVSPLTYLIEVKGRIRFVQQNQLKNDKSCDKDSNTTVETESDNQSRVSEEETPVLRTSSRRKFKTKHFGDNMYENN